MDALFQTQSNELSTTTQKEKLFKDAERQWNTLSSEKGAPGRKVDFEIYKSILYNLEIRKVYLDSKLSLEKFSSIVRHEYDLPEQCGEQLLRMQLQAIDKFLQGGSREGVAGR